MFGDYFRKKITTKMKSTVFLLLSVITVSTAEIAVTYNIIPACSYLNNDDNRYNALVTKDGKVCCMCGKGHFMAKLCNESGPETTLCLPCTHTSVRRTYIDYEPHDRKECFPDEICMYQKMPVGGSRYKKSKCVCPDGTIEKKWGCEKVTVATGINIGTPIQLINMDQSEVKRSSEIPTSHFSSPTKGIHALTPAPSTLLSKLTSHVAEQNAELHTSTVTFGTRDFIIVVAAVVLVVVVLFLLLCYKKRFCCFNGFSKKKTSIQNHNMTEMEEKRPLTDESKQSSRSTFAGDAVTDDEAVPFDNANSISGQNFQCVQQNLGAARTSSLHERQPSIHLPQNEKKKRDEALDEMAEVIVKNDLMVLCHTLLAKDPRFFESIDHGMSTHNMALRAFERAKQIETNLSLQMLLTLVRNLQYLKDIIEDKINELPR